MSKKTYLAAVMVTCHIDGERVTVEPGEPLPELSKHDIEQLLAMKAIRDPDADADAERTAARAEKAAQAPFKAARSAVAAEADSTKP